MKRPFNRVWSARLHLRGVSPWLTGLALGLGLALGSRAADPAPVFAEDFSRVAVGELPSPFLVLNGVFEVKEEAGNRFVELPGAPLEDFGFLFGPSEAQGVEVSARVLATKQGRKFPTFAVGLNGGGGYKLRVVPAKRAVELVKGDDVIATAAFEWKSGEWTHLKLRVRAVGNAFKVEAKAWQGDAEPSAWTISQDAAEALPAGRAGLWGLPFSGTPMRFDDLRIARVAP